MDDAEEFHQPNDRYKLYVENCIKKNIRPFGPKQWAKREQNKHKAIEQAQKLQEDKEHSEKINIRFIIMMRLEGHAKWPDNYNQALHYLRIGEPTKTWNNNQPEACPLCKDILCAWAK